MDEPQGPTSQDRLPMPSDLRRAAPQGESAGELVEPPGAKLIVRLFLIPALIVAAAVGVMFLIGSLAGREPSMEEALQGLRGRGGQRTTSYLIGPGSKQRYLYAKTLADTMKQGLDLSQRLHLTDELIEILDHHTQADEGEVQHFLLLALGRVWQGERSDAVAHSDAPAAVAARQRVVEALVRYARRPELEPRKAAVLSMAYLAGHEQVQHAVPLLVETLSDPQADLDVRLAAATTLGPVASPDDARVIEALNRALRTDDERQAELIWAAALSLAQLNRPEARDTILKLLDREELAQLRYYDRETDPRNPSFRPLNDQEQQRFLINTMLGAQHLDDERVHQRLQALSQDDPSPRVRAAAREILSRRSGAPPP
jgi:hypothetical protein